MAANTAEVTRTPTPTASITPTFTTSPTPTATSPLDALGTPGAGSVGGPVVIVPPTPVIVGGGFPSSGTTQPPVVVPPVVVPGSNGSGTGSSAGGGIPVVATPTPVPPTATPTIVVWTCNGDERMDFVPAEPLVGDEVFITVSSAGDHAYVQMHGPAPFETIGKGTGGPGFYWQWKKKVDKAGSYTFDFYSGPSQQYRCVTGTFRAGTNTLPTATPTSRIVATPTPSATPRPDR